jgi:hypothetical protein
MKKYLFLISALCAGIFLLTPMVFAVSTADVIFVIDESGSMANEHAWIGSMVSDLDAGLIDAGITGNQYALVGFGGHREVTSSDEPHSHTVGGGLWGSATDLTTASDGLIAFGGFEDGLSAIDFAFDNYAFRSTAATNIILITDEDRDLQNTAVNFNSVKTLLSNQGAILNAVVGAAYNKDSGVLGIDSEDIAYKADGFGGFISDDLGSTPGASDFDIIYFGQTIADIYDNYIKLAWETGGAMWDLSKLRGGGITATSFTSAFVDIKVEEIGQQEPSPVPEPATILLLSFGLIGLGVGGRRKLIK